MFQAIIVFLIVALSFQTVPVALGLKSDFGSLRTLGFALLIPLTQVALFLAGIATGLRLMHLLADIRGIVLFAGFALIGVRMIIESFRVRKGERTYRLEQIQAVLLAASAQAIYTFLAALLLASLVIDWRMMVLALSVSTLFMSGLGVSLKQGKTALSLCSFLFVLGGIYMLVCAVYLGLIQ